jgi:hypothetical protein
MRRSEVTLIAAGGALLAGAALLGRLHAPAADTTDPRHSVRLAGPSGAKALPAILNRLGVPTAERTTPLFALDSGAAPPPAPGTTLVLLQSRSRPTGEELRALRGWVSRGGRLVAAGTTGVERCFGFVTKPIGVAPIPPIGTTLPPLHVPAAALRRSPLESDEDKPLAARPCPPLPALALAPLLIQGADTIALALRFAGGGELLLIADAQLLTNRVLKESPLGADAVTWLIEGRPARVVFDEYHQGFGARASLFGATWRYVRLTPAGWTVLQLAVAALLLLALAAVRFGPPVPVIERRRRRPLEHLDALASGLERGQAGAHAAKLLVSGLRRRLNPFAPPREARLAAWLLALERGARSDAARTAVHRLRRMLDAPGDTPSILDAASAVEDVWDTLKAPASPRTS